MRIATEEAHLAIEVTFLELRAPVLRQPCAGMVPVTSGSDMHWPRIQGGVNVADADHFDK